MSRDYRSPEEAIAWNLQLIYEWLDEKAIVQLRRIADALENKSAATWPEVGVQNLKVGDRIYDGSRNDIRTIVDIVETNRDPRTGNRYLSIQFDDKTSISSSTVYGGLFQREPAKP